MNLWTKTSTKNHWVFSLVITFWFLMFFSLSSDALKLDIGLISLSPVVVIPLLSFGIFPSIRRLFFNGHIGDQNFRYIYFAVIAFLSMMFVQTILSDWPIRATAELTKTFLFFFVTHMFFSMIMLTKKLQSAVRLSVLVSGLFFAYLAYVYLFEFGVYFIGNVLSGPDKTGRNTLALFMFFCVILAVGSLEENRGIITKTFHYFLIFFILLIGFMTGSRFAAVFPMTFLTFIFFYRLFFNYRKINYFIVMILFVIIIAILLIPEAKITSIYINLDGINRLLDSSKGSSDSIRVALIRTGFDCFSDNNILFGHGVKDYLTCVQRSSIGLDLILHNEYLSLLNNVGIFGTLLWIFIISTYSKIFSFSRNNYIYRLGVLVYLLGLLVVDGYNSPIFALLLALSRHEWVIHPKNSCVGN